MKMFDYCISNPPYQDCTAVNTSPLSIYPFFILLGSRLSKNSIMVHPSRAFKGASKSDKKVVEKIKDSKRFLVSYDNKHTPEVFPTVKIPGGIMVSIHGVKNKKYHYIDESMDKELWSIKNKVIHSHDFVPITDIIIRRNNKIIHEGKTYLLNTNVFNNTELFDEEGCEIVGRYNLKRTIRRVDYSKITGEVDNKWKVFVPSAGGGGGYNGAIGQPLIGKPGQLNTFTFIVFGYFDTEKEAQNCMKYLKSKFCRALLSTLKITQHNTKKTWVNVPLVDFSLDIYDDNIDDYFYDKYNMNEKEIQWINNNIREMS